MVRSIGKAPITAPRASTQPTAQQKTATPKKLQPSEMLGLPAHRRSPFERMAPKAYQALQSPYSLVVAGVAAREAMKQAMGEILPEEVTHNSPEFLEKLISGTAALGAIVGTHAFQQVGHLLFDSSVKEMVKLNQAFAWETGPHAEAVSDLLTHVISSQPEAQREAVMTHLATRWDNLREPFFQLFSKNSGDKARGARTLGTDAKLNELLGFEALTPDAKSNAWARLEMLMNPLLSGVPGLVALKANQAQQLGEKWNSATASIPNRAEYFWRGQAGISTPGIAERWKDEASFVAAVALDVVGVSPSACWESLEIAAHLSTPEGERLLEKFDELGPKAVKLAGVLFDTKGTVNWQKAYQALGEVQGRQFRQELSDAGLVDMRGLTPIGKMVVQAKLPAALTTEEGEHLSVAFDKLSPQAVKLARLNLIAEGPIDWAKAYQALGDIHGSRFRQELKDAGFMDDQGLTRMGRAVVSTKSPETEGSDLAKLRERYGSLQR